MPSSTIEGATQQERVDSPHAAPKGLEGLTRRATLGFADNVLQQVARFITGIVVSPIIINGLGAEMYGAWTMIQQTVGYLALSDLRPTGTLKFLLATQQHIDAPAEKRRQIGAALAVWYRMVLLVLALGAVVTWLAPRFIHTAPRSQPAVRWAMALSVLAVALDPLSSLPGNVLRGMNLDYKAMGVKAGVIVITGALNVLAIRCGLGLAGIAGTTVVGLVLTGVVRLWVARRALPWFGADRPERKDVAAFAKMTGWLFVAGLGGVLLNASDILVVGLVLGPASAAIYTTTGAALRMMVDPMFAMLAAGNPGVAGLCGQRDWKRVERVRLDTSVGTITMMVVIGVGVLALNDSFLSLWVGRKFFGGPLTNLLLVLLACQLIPFRTDSMIVDGVLEFRAKAISNCVSGLMGLGLGALFAERLGLAGMALGTMLGRSVNVFYFPYLIRRRTGISIRRYIITVCRPVLVGCILFVIAYRVPIHVSSWMRFCIAAATLGGCTMAVMWTVGLGGRERQALTNRLVAQLSALRQLGRSATVALRGNTP